MEVFLNNPYLAVVGVLAALDTFLLLVLFWAIIRIRKKFSGLSPAEENHLAGSLAKQQKILNSHAKNIKELGEIIVELIERNRLNIQKVGLVRYNPFAETGGNFSFSLALLDGHDNGIVLSSLHGRGGTRVYTKTISKGQSESTLSDEEKQALKEAGAGNGTKKKSFKV